MKKILWMPIDVPKFPIENFYIQPDKNWVFWNYKNLTTDRITSYAESTLTDTIKEQYPELVSWLENFPILKICNIKYNIQKQIVSPHVDFTKPSDNFELYYNNLLNDPCGYRVLLSGSRKEKLYIVTKDGKKYTELPQSTDVYVLGQTNCKHGVDDEDGRCSLYLHFYIDKNKHKELLEKSWVKYKDYAICI